MSLYSIGIDPGKNTGFAAYDRHNKSLEILLNTDFVNALRLMSTSYPVSNVYTVVVEVPMTKHNWHNDKSGITAHNIGRVCREAELMAAMLIGMGYNVITQHPKGKIKADDFKRITGYSGRTNEHTRDAGMLCWGL